MGFKQTKWWPGLPRVVVSSIKIYEKKSTYKNTVNKYHQLARSAVYGEVIQNLKEKSTNKIDWRLLWGWSEAEKHQYLNTIRRVQLQIITSKSQSRVFINAKYCVFYAKN